jgi:hypothetical protein
MGLEKPPILLHFWILQSQVQLQLRQKAGHIPLAEGYPMARGEYLVFHLCTIPTVGL